MKSLLRPGALALSLPALLLTGCLTLGPDYERPELPVPDTYSAPPASSAAEASIAPDWWTEFGDPALDALVAEALSANQDLVAAVARVDEARAIAGLTDADRLPAITGGASGSRDRFSEQTSQFPPGVPLERDTYRASASLSFELDFWGRLARLSEAARAELLASEEGRRNVELAVAAETVTAYFDLLALDRQLAVADATLASRQEAVRLQRLRFDAGTISELDLAQAEAELAATESAVPLRQRALRRTEDRLTVLLGRIGGTIPRPSGIGPDGTGIEVSQVRIPDVPVGLPSDLLVRRPDLVAAEQRLIAANARIGAARAAYFPSISLTGYAGSESDELSGLFKSGTSIWGLAASVLQPIFQGGKVRRGVEIAEARQRQALASYTLTVQTAFAEVEDALVDRRTSIAEREALGRQVEALNRAQHLARLRYDAGDSSYIDVLDAERNLFSAQLAWITARRAEFAAAVQLFKALGGGWATEPEAAPPA
ncbi:MAG: efflux transporter outer membrane subunit [Thermoanaerobaculia bacterium]